MSHGMNLETQVRIFEDEFVELVESRRQAGAEEYGQFAFMTNNTFQMMYEELADMCNYALFTYTKVRVLEEQLNAIRTNSPDLFAGGDTR